MKQVLSVLILSLVVIPVLTVNTAAANNGDEGRGRRHEETLTRWNQHLRYGERDRAFRGDFGRSLDGGTGTPTMPGDPAPGDPSGSGNGQSAPLGGIALLLAAGLGLGVKKASHMRNAVKNVEIPE